MATYTTYKNLEKPDVTELYNINVANKNNDILDSELHKIELSIGNQNELFAAKQDLNNEISRAIAKENSITDSLDEHTGNQSNPHQVTKAQIGLSNADNTSDMDKPVSAAQQDALNSALFDHNTAESSHSDIRLLVSNLATRLNALADSDDTTLDQLSEIVAYIKNNNSLIDGITTDKVNVSDIIDNLTSDFTDKPLSAKQGAILKELFTDLTAITGNKVDKVSGMGLSENDFTTADKNKLSSIALGANVNVQPDWNETDSASDAFIKNKPAISTNQEFLDFLKENGLFDLDSKGRPLLPGYGISTINVTTNIPQITTDKGTSIVIADTSDFNVDEKDVIGIIGKCTGVASEYVFDYQITGTEIRLVRYWTMPAKTNVPFKLGLIYKLPVPYEQGLRTISLTKDVTIAGNYTVGNFAALEEFGISNPEDVVSVQAVSNSSLTSAIMAYMDNNTAIKIKSLINYEASISCTVTLIVKAPSSIGSSIVTETRQPFVKDIIQHFKRNSNYTLLTLDGSENCGGFTKDTVSSVNVTSIPTDEYPTAMELCCFVRNNGEIGCGAVKNPDTYEATVNVRLKIE